jgi:hypothetical protein
METYLKQSGLEELSLNDMVYIDGGLSEGGFWHGFLTGFLTVLLIVALI